MYMGDEHIIESTSGPVNSTRIATTVERFGLKTNQLKWGGLVDDNKFHVYWGSFILRQ
jgi:hypothetical protein